MQQSQFRDRSSVFLQFTVIMSSRGYSGTGDKADLDNHADQCNPNSSKYQGYTSGYKGKGDKADLDNHSRQLNPQDSKYNGPKGLK